MSVDYVIMTMVKEENNERKRGKKKKRYTRFTARDNFSIFHL